jgi:hypothetical protein
MSGIWMKWKINSIGLYNQIFHAIFSGLQPICIINCPIFIIHLSNISNMPKDVGLSAMLRIEIMNDRLRKDKWWTKEALFKEVNRYVEALRDKPVAESTLRGDLEVIKDRAGENFIEEMRVPNGGKRKRLHFRYADPEFSYFGAAPLASGEYAILQQAIELLSEIKADTVVNELKEIIQKLKFSYQTPEWQRVQYEQPDLLGLDLMQQLYEAIRDKKVIGFRYQPFDQKQPQDFVMHPYVLKEYNKRWYVVGLAEPQQKIWVCAFDRFKSDPKIKSHPFIAPDALGFDPVGHFKDVIGPTVRKENPVEEVILKFTANRAPYVITKKLHHSQELLRTYADGSVSFRYRLRFNKELLGLILGFGEDVQVMGPLSLVEKVSRAMEGILKHYKKHL